MKNIFWLLILFAANSARASFPVNTSVYAGPNYAQATACNETYNVPIICRTTASGWTEIGGWVSEYVDLILYPGQCDYAYVYANGGNAFTQVSANATCNYYAPVQVYTPQAQTYFPNPVYPAPYWTARPGFIGRR